MSGVQPRTKAVFFPAVPSVDALTGRLLSGYSRDKNDDGDFSRKMDFCQFAAFPPGGL
jgi:hypothetical protein